VRGHSRALGIRLKTVQALSLPMPPTVLFQADAVLKEESVGARFAVRVGERPVRKPGVFQTIGDLGKLRGVMLCNAGYVHGDTLR
jgi:hypothetical protein